jgi:hypothetical protein
MSARGKQEMRTSCARRTRRILLAVALAVSGIVVVQDQARADTMQIHGVNWADQRDNFVNGVLYVSGLSSADTYASAAVVADRVVGQLYSITGANTVRMPINEPTVATYWNIYTGAIDQALTKGKVILAYWAYGSGRPASVAAYYGSRHLLAGQGIFAVEACALVEPACSGLVAAAPVAPVGVVAGWFGLVQCGGE